MVKSNIQRDIVDNTETFKIVVPIDMPLLIVEKFTSLCLYDHHDDISTAFTDWNIKREL